MHSAMAASALALAGVIAFLLAVGCTADAEREVSAGVEELRGTPPPPPQTGVRAGPVTLVTRAEVPLGKLHDDGLYRHKVLVLIDTEADPTGAMFRMWAESDAPGGLRFSHGSPTAEAQPVVNYVVEDRGHGEGEPTDIPGWFLFHSRGCSEVFVSIDEAVWGPVSFCVT